MNLSYWEQDTLLKRSDFTIIGSGIVGLNAALRLRELHPKAQIRILERGALPSGASTKNAGFACFGSISELESDLQSIGLEQTLITLEKRKKGLDQSLQMHGKERIDFRADRGIEVFRAGNEEKVAYYLDRIDFWNKELRSIVGNEVYHINSLQAGMRGFHSKVIVNAYEGLLHPGKLIQELISKCQKSEIQILCGLELKAFHSAEDEIYLEGDEWEAQTGQLLLATNAFTSKLLPHIPVQAARNLVLVTNPLANNPLRGGYHLDEGYFYFRNIHDRILIGGGRQLDPETESTAEFGTNPLIREELVRLISEHIIPEIPFQIDAEWSGILGIGTEKSAIVQRIDPQLSIGVRLGGMGVAIGTLVGRELAELCS